MFVKRFQANLLCNNEGIAPQAVNYLGDRVDVVLASLASDTQLRPELPLVEVDAVAEEVGRLLRKSWKLKYGLSAIR